MAYIKKYSRLLSNLRNAEAALKTMEGFGPGHAELRAESEYKSVAASLAILSISPIEQIYVPVTRVAKYVPELTLSRG